MGEQQQHDLDLATIAVRGVPHRQRNDEVAPPIHISTTFFSADAPQPGDYTYARGDTPANAQTEPVLAALDGASDCVVFNAGISAANAVFAEAPAGSAVVLPYDAYYGIRARAERELPQRGVEVRLVDQADLAGVEDSLKGAALLWVETPTNPLLAVANLKAIGALAARLGVPWYIDNTFASPVLQRPLAFGAAGSMQSLTKYAGGHSDVMAGAVATSDPELAGRLRVRRNDSGTQLDGFSAWLVRRGLQTMPLRVRHQSASALRLAERLAKHPAVERVYYPGLPDHPGHDVAGNQMHSGFGGMLSILVNGGEVAAQRVLQHCQLWVPATSLGGVESLIERRARWTGETAPPHLLRLSVGLEDIEDLWHDLHQALGQP